MARFPLPVLMGVVVVVLAAVILGSMTFNAVPQFAASGSCSSASVILYSAEYKPAEKSILLDVENRGGMDLALESFLQGKDGKIQKHRTIIFLSSGRRDTFTLSSVNEKPAELTVRNRQGNCPVSDLWKF